MQTKEVTKADKVEMALSLNSNTQRRKTKATVLHSHHQELKLINHVRLVQVSNKTILQEVSHRFKAAELSHLISPKFQSILASSKTSFTGSHKATQDKVISQ